jgi:hypothetical protein
LTWPANVNDLIRGFVAPATGTYYVRVSGTPQTQYSLVATRNTEFDLEPNDTPASAQSLLVSDVSGRQWVLGAIENDGSDGRDVYQLLLDGGAPLSVETFTPAAGPGQFQNALDPMILLYDAEGNIVASDDNSASDGRNAALRYRVPRGAEGIYYLAVIAGSSGDGMAGEYYVSVRGSTLPQSVLNLLAAATEPATDAMTVADESTQLKLAADGEEDSSAEGPTLLPQAVVEWLPDAFDDHDGLDQIAEDVSGLLELGAEISTDGDLLG